ncbi:hypothetical protein [Streptomyces sp. TP-A0356]|uniref:hypothetical protein n=1 Tax=Streptomyces sp. TP-A0356 TaxID=1359208 RepID=UPI0006E416F3|nr:hypothetical protein [Streptomyces sp. TP-A0356]
MPAHVSTFQLLGAPVLLAVTVWIVCLGRVLRRRRFEDTVRRHGPLLGALPRQRQARPDLESVELTPAERDAFAGLVRQFGDRRC